MPSTTRRNRRGDTPPPRTGSSETEVLRGFLDYLRTSIAAKVDGVPEPQARTAVVPSGTNLLGLLNHLTFVERWTPRTDRRHDRPLIHLGSAHAKVDSSCSPVRKAEGAEGRIELFTSSAGTGANELRLGPRVPSSGDIQGGRGGWMDGGGGPCQSLVGQLPSLPRRDVGIPDDHASDSASQHR
ncbi:DUF664 domain-containing protein [Streptomyces sp. NPDC058000]|uniref:mycothiol transferase n=1 Tax=Streptomyces sp. NPDC058000 TaxID=3346299 RepID=UPI0036E5B659